MKDQMTPKAEHTPGPWHFRKYSDGVFIMDADTNRIACLGQEQFPGQCDANARLIAAAPKYADDRAALLEACKALVVAETNGQYDHARELARAAIAKAEAEGEGK